jgi:hypothetical protein
VEVGEDTLTVQHMRRLMEETPRAATLAESLARSAA